MSAGGGGLESASASQDRQAANNEGENAEDEAIDTQSEADIEEEEKKLKKRETFLEKAFHFVLEIVAIFDMLGDIYVLLSLIELSHYMWSVLTVF